jgi:hypothetical protein
MHLSRRLLIVPLMLGVILSFAAAGFGTPSASAQVPSYGNVQNCLPIGNVMSCIVTVSNAGPIQATLNTTGTWGNGCISTSSSITVTCSVDSTGTMITISCSGGCPANTSVQVIVNGSGGTPTVTFAQAGGSTSTYSTSSYVAPAYTSTAPVGSITVGQQQPAVQVTVSNTQPAYSSAYSNAYATGGQCVNGSYPTALGCTAGYVPYYQPVSYFANSGYSNGCVGIWGGCAGGCSGFTWGCFSNCFSSFFCNGSNFCTGFGFNNNGCGNNVSHCTGFGFNNNGCGNNNCFSFSFCNGFNNGFNHGVTCPTGTTFHRTLNSAGQNCY